jgi:antitoxin ParD1/3/4
MNVKVGAELERFIAQRVKTGEYTTASEVVRDGLRPLQLRQLQIDDLRRAVNEGIKAAEEGRYITYTAETSHLLIEKIKREGRKRLAAKRAG